MKELINSKPDKVWSLLVLLLYVLGLRIKRRVIESSPTTPRYRPEDHVLIQSVLKLNLSPNRYGPTFTVHIHDWRKIQPPLLRHPMKDPNQLHSVPSRDKTLG